MQLGVASTEFVTEDRNAVKAMLDVLARMVQRHPGWLLAAVAVATGGLGFFAAQQEADVDITAFAPDTELANAFDRVQNDFAAGGGAVQVILDAGPDGDVVSPEGVRAAVRVQQAVAGDAEVADGLAEGTPQAPAVVSFASPILGALQEQGLNVTEVAGEQLDQLAAQVLGSEQGAQLAGLLSRDRDVPAADARGGIVLVRLDPGLTQVEEQQVGTAVRDLVQELELPGGVEALPFSQGILFAELEGGLQEQLPFLLGLSLLLIVGILAAIYRSVSDVVLGLVGLVVTIVWMYGFGVLLGPDYLGVTGNFSQIAIVIPVLLVGLGIDYAIHLTSRYREELGAGADIDTAARVSVVSVGGALVLATITTIIGFVTNWFTPLPPIRDFGLFTAFGVLSAFVVMATLVPAGRHLLDARRRETIEGRVAARGEAGEGPLALSRMMARLALLTEHVPGWTLGIATVVTVVAAVGATQLSTAFSQEDFIPEGSYAQQVLDRTQTLFGGDLTEQTYVLVEGDLTDPAVANAMLAAQAAIGEQVDEDLVRRTAAGAQVSSASGLVAQLAARAAQPTAGSAPGADPQQLQQALQANGWTDQGFAPDADLPALYDLVSQALPGEVDRLLAADADAGLITIGSTAGEDRADELAETLQSPLQPLREAAADVTVVSEPLVINEIIDAMTASQIRSIVITLVAALVLLVGYYGLVDRRPLLGAVTMVPSVLSVAWVLGSMYVLGLSFNVLTSTIAALGIGIGVPYGIHITHRFVEDRRRAGSTDEAMRATIMHTGGALAGSAATTAVGFGVLVFSDLAPIRQFGGVTALTIIFALAGSVLVQPSLLALWDRRDRRRHPAPASPAEVARP
jgi:uncharacterized protein